MMSSIHLASGSPTRPPFSPRLAWESFPDQPLRRRGEHIDGLTVEADRPRRTLWVTTRFSSRLLPVSNKTDMEPEGVRMLSFMFCCYCGPRQNAKKARMNRRNRRY